MLQAILVLTRARLQILRNTFWRGSLGSKLGTLALLALAGFGTFASYSFTRAAVSFLRSPELADALAELAATDPSLPTDPSLLLAALPGAVLLGALGLLVLSSFGSLLNTLFLAGDLDMLLVAPVPMRAVFVVKFFGGLAPQYALLIILLLPTLLGYGAGMGYGPLFQLCAALALLLTPLLPAGLAALLLMAVVRVLPARRTREVISVLGGLIGISFYVLTQVSAQFGPLVVNPGSLEALLATNVPLLPSAWAGRALVAAGEGDLLSLTVYGGLFLVGSASVFAACLVLAERLYYAGWSNLASEGAKVRTGRRDAREATPAWPNLLSALLPPESRAILVKDVRLFFRDLRNLQALIFPFAFAAIWTYQLLSGPRGATSANLPAWLERIQQLAGAGIAFFICLSLSSTLAGTGVSREGKGYWVLKLAPVSPWRLLLGKFTLAFLPFPLVGTFFLLALGVVGSIGPLTIFQQWLLLMLCGLGCAAFGMGLGAAFPKLDWENPSQQATWQSGCIGTLVYPTFVLLNLALVAGGAAIGELLGGGAAALGAELLGWTLAAGITGALVWLSALIGIRGLERIDV